MCVKGFVMLINSVCGLSHDLLKQQRYFLTYKCSQDHLELFFNAIRRAGGWNNNPTASIFSSVFQKIIAHCGALQVSMHGNCVPIDETTMVKASLSTYMPPDTPDSSEQDDLPDPFMSCFQVKTNSPSCMQPVHHAKEEQPRIQQRQMSQTFCHKQSLICSKL
ncbi:PREDICTED: uncharacterized protein LOC106818507 [Priapulus caudatus]|uniref:Uncharacterized protein LOC106818507 n=1 Tax=Priapulus caudatus TaxID=37621 RepID=A0ABM1F2L8_PRICU|nr:PREDICTED: uncharacterized protein LOC106818507 [Priapulus caudatus]